MSRPRIWILIGLVIGLTGCATVEWKPGQGGLVYTRPTGLKPRPTYEVQVFYSESEVPYPYTQLGIIRVKPWTGPVDLKAKWQVFKVKERAAKEGADAVILPSNPDPNTIEAIAILKR